MTGSIAGIKGIAGMSVYCASKAAVRSLARTWTLDLKSRDIRVNVLSPGHTDTAVFDVVSQEVINLITTTIPLGRFGKPEEMAKQLCS
jgi:NAD(P)-dependent dehydrogenase (short-subunit alcohol dehydrogenase family)